MHLVADNVAEDIVYCKHWKRGSSCERDCHVLGIMLMASRSRRSFSSKREAMSSNCKTESNGPAAKSAKIEMSKVAAIFESLDYGPAPESAEIAKKWIESHGGTLGHFINGKWVKPNGRKLYDSFSPATGGWQVGSYAFLCNYGDQTVMIY